MKHLVKVSPEILLAEITAADSVGTTWDLVGVGPGDVQAAGHVDLLFRIGDRQILNIVLSVDGTWSVSAELDTGD